MLKKLKAAQCIRLKTHFPAGRIKKWSDIVRYIIAVDT